MVPMATYYITSDKLYSKIWGIRYPKCEQMLKGKYHSSRFLFWMFSLVPRPSHVSNVTCRKGTFQYATLKSWEWDWGWGLMSVLKLSLMWVYQNSLWKCARKGTYNRYLWLGPLQRPVCIHREGCAGRDRCHQRTGSEWCGTSWTVRERRKQEGWVWVWKTTETKSNKNCVLLAL